MLTLLEKHDKWIWNLLFLLFVFLVRYHTLFYHYWDWDEAAMMSEAWAMTQGQVLYKDIYQIHPPFQFFIFIPFFFSLPSSLVPFAVKFMNMLLVYLGALLIRKTIAGIYHDSWTTNVSALLFIFYVSYYGWAQSSHGEFYTIFPILATAYLILTKGNLSNLTALGIGLLWGIAFFIKQIAFFDIVPLFVVFLWRKDLRTPKAKIPLFFLIGIALATFLAFLYPVLHGTVKETTQSILFHNVGTYVTGESPESYLAGLGSLFLNFKTVLFGLFVDFFGYHRFLSVLVGVVTILLWSISRFRKEPPLLSSYRLPLFSSIFWTVSIFLGIALTGRYYPHYLLQLAPPLVIFYSFWIATIHLSFRKILVIGMAVGFMLAGINLFYKERRNLPNILNTVERSKEIAAFIRGNTQKQDTILLFCEESLDVYYLSERLSPNGIYMHLDMDSAHTNDPRSEALYRSKLEANLPKIIVWGTDPKHLPSTSAADFWGQLIREHYTFKTEIHGARFFIRDS